MVQRLFVQRQLQPADRVEPSIPPVRRTSLLGLAATLVIALAPAAIASASPLPSLRHDGRVVVRDDPYLPAEQMAPPASARAAGPSSSKRRAAAPLRTHGARARHRTVRGELGRLLHAAAITKAAYDEYRSILYQAEKTHDKLGGTRRSALGATLTNLAQIAASGQLTASRLPALLETVKRNRAWWSSGPLLANGRRVSFQGSPLVWQYYSGQGLQIQWLGSFGKANALWHDHKDAALRALLDEALRLASDRAGGIAWEYLFHFGGGRPPWVSGLAQGTGIQALARAGVRLGDARYIGGAHRALGIFRERPPSGVRITTGAGAHYLIYSYAPGQRVLNAFTQALNGLYDYASLTNDAEGRVLFAQGDAQLRRELSSYDTGAWSRYSPGVEADLSYHTLARDFLRGLCARLTAQENVIAGRSEPTSPPLAPVLPGADPAAYCSQAARFTSYLTREPRLQLLSHSVRAGRAASLRVKLDKPSFVRLVLLRGRRTVRVLTAHLSGGRHSLLWSSPRTTGTYDVQLRATDLAGNSGSSQDRLRVLKKH